MSGHSQHGTVMLTACIHKHALRHACTQACMHPPHSPPPHTHTYTYTYVHNIYCNCLHILTSYIYIYIYTCWAMCLCTTDTSLKSPCMTVGTDNVTVGTDNVPTPLHSVHAFSHDLQLQGAQFADRAEVWNWRSLHCLGCMSIWAWSWHLRDRWTDMGFQAQLFWNRSAAALVWKSLHQQSRWGPTCSYSHFFTMQWWWTISSAKPVCVIGLPANVLAVLVPQICCNLYALSLFRWSLF